MRPKFVVGFLLAFSLALGVWIVSEAKTQKPTPKVPEAASKIPEMKPKKVRIINNTDQKLCLYAGYNLLTCGFDPKMTVDVTVPTQVYYNNRHYKTTIFRVTDQGKEETNSKDNTRVRKRLAFCQKKDFQNPGLPPWEIKKPSMEADCTPGPRFKGDMPFGQH